MTDKYSGKEMENQDKNSLADEHECHQDFCDRNLENYEPKIKEEPNKHPYGCHDDWEICYECIDKYEELHPNREVNLLKAHKCVPGCDQLNNKHIGIHRTMSLEGEKWETEEKKLAGVVFTHFW